MVIVDFSYPRAVLQEMSSRAKSLVLLDHHSTAASNLMGFQGGQMVIDKTRCGAALAWHHFNRGRLPKLLEYVEDYDLAKFALSETREVILGLQSYPLQFEIWDGMDISRLIQDGTVIRRFYEQKLEEVLSRSFRQVIGGHEVPICNVPIFMADDVARRLAVREKFGVAVWHTDEGSTYSLRSDSNGLDVAEIASAFGGGGQKHSAAFRGRCTTMET